MISLRAVTIASHLLAALVLIHPASADQSLVASRVTVISTKDVRPTVWGTVAMPNETTVPGRVEIKQPQSSTATLEMLGCRFEMIPTSDNEALNTAAPLFARKLVSGTPPTSLTGRLENPEAIGVLDPLTATSCKPDKTYYFFLYRRTPTFGELIVEALILEYDEGGRLMFEGRTFAASYDEKPSLQVANAIRNADNFFRIDFRTPSDAAAASADREAFWKSLLSVARLGLP